MQWTSSHKNAIFFKTYPKALIMPHNSVSMILVVLLSCGLNSYNFPGFKYHTGLFPDGFVGFFQMWLSLNHQAMPTLPITHNFHLNEEIISSPCVSIIFINVFKKKNIIIFLGFSGGSGINNLPANSGYKGLIPGLGISPREEMATHSSILAWEIPWTEEPGGLQSLGLQRVDMTYRINNNKYSSQKQRTKIPLSFKTEKHSNQIHYSFFSW